VISRPYFIAATEVTQAQWKTVTGNNPSKNQGDDLPVEQVSWDDAREFIRKLNAHEEAPAEVTSVSGLSRMGAIGN
jgi:formylglycine-generating enzyme required for sulfatase activity